MLGVAPANEPSQVGIRQTRFLQFANVNGRVPGVTLRLTCGPQGVPEQQEPRSDSGFSGWTGIGQRCGRGGQPHGKLQCRLIRHMGRYRRQRPIRGGKPIPFATSSIWVIEKTARKWASIPAFFCKSAVPSGAAYCTNEQKGAPLIKPCPLRGRSIALKTSAANVDYSDGERGVACQ
jgi:hypothetical protein